MALAAARPLRSAALSCRAVLLHQLRKPGTLWGEEVAAALLREPDDLLGKMERMLQTFEERFLKDYDPCVFVEVLPSLTSLDDSVRERLIDALRGAYQARFRPLERQEELRRHAAAFEEALSAWRACILESGVTARSEPLWQRFLQAAKALHDWLDDPELATRWIP